MNESLTTLLLSTATVGAGLMAGVYFAFSCFIMRAFERLGPAQATAAMNSINDVILRSGFMILFFGSIILYAILGVLAVLDAGLTNRWILSLASIIVIVGMFLCTVIFNVPLNNRLASAGGRNSAGVETWSHYLKHWTRWNHLRSASSFAAMALSVYYLVAYD